MFLSLNVKAQLLPCENRDDITTLSIQDRNELNTKILDYVTSIDNPDYDPTDLDPLKSWIEYKYSIIGEHTQWGDNDQTIINHSNEEFLSWHRYYISGLEDYLSSLGYDDYVPLPFWNPEVPMPDEFYDKMIQEYLDEGINKPYGPEYISDPLMTWNSSIEITDDLCIDFVDADDLGNTLVADAMHSSVHFEVGGAMRSQAATSGASIFWPLHAHIDRYYRCYQIDCQCPQMEVTGYNENCDYCFDFSQSTNADTYSITLIDESGNEEEITLNASGCIPYEQMIAGRSYTAQIQGVNSEMMDNIDCPNDEVMHSFIAPQGTSTKFNPNPCIGIEPAPQFPTDQVFNGPFLVNLTSSNSNTEWISIINSNINTGDSYLIFENISIEAGATIQVEIPSYAISSGINNFSIILNNDTNGFNYTVQ